MNKMGVLEERKSFRYEVNINFSAEYQNKRIEIKGNESAFGKQHYLIDKLLNIIEIVNFVISLVEKYKRWILVIGFLFLYDKK